MPAAAATLRQTPYITLKQVPYTAVGDTLNTILFLFAVFAASAWSANRIIVMEKNGTIALFLGNVERRIRDQDKKIERAARNLLLLTLEKGVWLSDESLRMISAKAGGEDAKARKLLEDILTAARESHPQEAKRGLISNNAIRLIVGKL